MPAPAIAGRAEKARQTPPLPRHAGPRIVEVAPHVFGLTQSIANLYLVGSRREANSWVLVDAGLPGSALQIRRAAEELYGKHTRPAAIVLTHGHFDHVGGLPHLLADWSAPVYAHRLELPYITGRSSYPPPDPTVGGGLMTCLSRLYPRGPIDVGRHALALPVDGTVPAMVGWKWIATPGHTPGHVSLFRESDRTLLAGDAFVTTRQESLLAAVAQPTFVWRPPAYYTCDWQAARDSISRLAALQPDIAATGHGRPMYGNDLREGLENLLAEWDEMVPSDGRYVRQPAVADDEGVKFVPPPVMDYRLLAAAGLAALGAYLYYRSSQSTSMQHNDGLSWLGSRCRAIAGRK